MNKKIDFTNAEELLNLCEAKDIPISEAMLQRETSKFEISRKEAEARMLKALNVMRESVARSQTEKMKLLGGYIGGRKGTACPCEKRRRSRRYDLPRGGVCDGRNRMECFHGPYRCRADSRFFGCASRYSRGNGGSLRF